MWFISVSHIQMTYEYVIGQIQMLTYQFPVRTLTRVVEFVGLNQCLVFLFLLLFFFFVFLFWSKLKEKLHIRSMCDGHSVRISKRSELKDLNISGFRLWWHFTYILPILGNTSQDMPHFKIFLKPFEII